MSDSGPGHVCLLLMRSKRLRDIMDTKAVVGSENYDSTRRMIDLIRLVTSLSMSLNS